MNIKIIAGKSESGTNQVIDLSQLQNSSLSMLGASGSGKTSTIKDFCYQAATQGAQVLVFDVSLDWSENRLYDPSGTVNTSTTSFSTAVVHRVNVRSPEICFNPLACKMKPSGELENPMDVGWYFSETMRNTCGIKEAQQYYLANTVCAYLQSSPIPGSLGGLISYITALDNDAVKMLMPSLGRLMNICRLVYCGLYPYGPDLNHPGITVLDYCDFPPGESAQALVTEMLVKDILDSRMMADPWQTVPLILVFDESQRFRFNESSALVRLLREGRRFGVSGWFSTQYLKKSADADALGNAAIQIQFRPVDTHVRAAARTMSHGDKALEKRLLEELPRLGRGQFFFRDGNGVLRKVARAAG